MVTFWERTVHLVNSMLCSLCGVFFFISVVSHVCFGGRELYCTTSSSLLTFCFYASDLSIGGYISKT